jgi:hypothetical protein
MPDPIPGYSSIWHWVWSSSSCAWSWDPNRIDVQPTRSLEVDGEMNKTYGIFESDNKLTYTIQFQNTGIWYAYNIALANDIDVSKLDLSTLNVFASSHNYRVNIENNQAQFIFENIMLPDSARDEPGSHGFISYTINRKPAQPVGTQIENFVDIYFDFNAPVRTNISRVRVVAPTTVTSTEETAAGTIAQAKVQPNPSNSNASISYELAEITDVSINIVDMTGRLVKTVMTSVSQGAGTYQMPLPTAELASGVYTIQLNSGKNNESIKFVKID